MQKVCARGVMKNGQVVLCEPLDLPDGTEVTVADCVADDSYKRRLLAALERLDLLNDPDWQIKAEPDRVAYIEQLVRDAETRAATGSASNAPEPYPTPGAA